MMTLGFAITAIISNLSTLELQPTVSVFLGLILGEVSKAINNYLSEGGI